MRLVGLSFTFLSHTSALSHGSCMEMIQNCVRWGSDLILGNISIHREDGQTLEGFLVCLCSIWTMPLIILFNFWSAMKWSGSWTRSLLWVPFDWNILCLGHPKSVPFELDQKHKNRKMGGMERYSLFINMPAWTWGKKNLPLPIKHCDQRFQLLYRASQFRICLQP